AGRHRQHQRFTRQIRAWRRAWQLRSSPHVRAGGPVDLYPPMRHLVRTTSPGANSFGNGRREKPVGWVKEKSPGAMRASLAARSLCHFVAGALLVLLSGPLPVWAGSPDGKKVCVADQQTAGATRPVADCHALPPEEEVCGSEEDQQRARALAAM